MIITYILTVVLFAQVVTSEPHFLLIEFDTGTLLYESPFSFSIPIPAQQPLKKHFSVVCQMSKECEIVEKLKSSIDATQQFQRALLRSEYDGDISDEPLMTLTLPKKMYDSVANICQQPKEDMLISDMYDVDDIAYLTSSINPEIVDADMPRIRPSKKGSSGRPRRSTKLNLLLGTAAMSGAYFGHKKVLDAATAVKALDKQLRDTPAQLQSLRQLVVRNNEALFKQQKYLHEISMELNGSRASIQDSLRKLQSQEERVTNILKNVQLQSIDFAFAVGKNSEIAFRKLQYAACAQNVRPNGWLSTEDWRILFEEKKKTIPAGLEMVPNSAEEFDYYRLFDCDGQTITANFGLSRKMSQYTITKITTIKFKTKQRGVCSIHLPASVYVLDFARNLALPFSEYTRNCITDRVCQIPTDAAVNFDHSRCIFDYIKDPHVVPESCSVICSDPSEKVLVVSESTSSVFFANFENVTYFTQNTGLRNTMTNVTLQMDGVFRIYLDCDSTLMVGTHTFHGRNFRCEEVKKTYYIHALMNFQNSSGDIDVDILSRVEREAFTAYDIANTVTTKVDLTFISSANFSLITFAMGVSLSIVLFGINYRRNARLMATLSRLV